MVCLLPIGSWVQLLSQRVINMCPSTGIYPALILASASPRRADLLRQMGISFTADPCHIEEKHPPFLTPAEMARWNAHAKARCVARKNPTAIVLGADTLVYMGLMVFGKPADMQEAHRMLGQLQGREHQVVTGVCLIKDEAGLVRLFDVRTTVRFRPLTRHQIEDYLRRINPLDKAGAYAIQEEGDLIIDSISGSYSNVVGLPQEKLAEELALFR